MDFNFDEYYSRHFPLKSVGRENQIRLQHRTALVAGVGGLGTKIAGLLASFGVGTIVLVDYDIIEQSNLPRQDLYTLSDVGEAKVDVAARRIKERNPVIEVKTFTYNIDGISVNELLGGVDIVFDGLDRFSTRRVLHAACYERKIPYIFAGSVSENANIMTFTFKKDTPCMECALGHVSDQEENTCAVLGVHPSILAITAAIQVSEGIRVLLDQRPTLEGKMLIISLDELEFDKITFQKREDCQLCLRIKKGLNQGQVGEVRRYSHEIEGRGKVSVASLCGRDTVIVTPSFNFPDDMDVILQRLQTRWRTSKKGDSVLSFYIRGIHCSLMESGVMTIRGAGNKENALDIYKLVIEVLFSTGIGEN